jgi:hypothetical protein
LRAIHAPSCCFRFGAVEQHGPHLPLLVDWLGGEELARRVAPHLERAGYRPILAPALPYGVSTLAIEWSGTVSLSVATLRRVIVDIVGNLARHGFRRFVLANYQADSGSSSARWLRSARARAHAPRASPVRGLRTGCTRRYRDGEIPRVLALMRSPRPDREWHSESARPRWSWPGRPDLVRRQLLRRLPAVWLDFRKSLREGARRFEEIDRRSRAQGYFGWPPRQRPRTAERAMALRGRLIARELVASLQAWKSERPSRGRRGSRRGGRR